MYRLGAHYFHSNRIHTHEHLNVYFCMISSTTAQAEAVHRSMMTGKLCNDKECLGTFHAEHAYRMEMCECVLTCIGNPSHKRNNLQE